MNRYIDINCDMGEERGDDKSIVQYISSANIACGGHAGSFKTMKETISLAKKFGVSVGAHPGYPDKENFGRIETDMDDEQITEEILRQLADFRNAASAVKCRLDHIKLHGALYNRASSDFNLMSKLASAVFETMGVIPFYVLAGSAAEKAVIDAGGIYYSEAFADRAYDANRRLVSRKIQGAVLHDAEIIAARALRIVEKEEVESITGKIIKLNADTICVHGDTPDSLQMAAKISDVFKSNGFSVRSCHAV